MLFGEFKYCPALLTTHGPTIMFQITEKLKFELFGRFILGCHKPISEFAFGKLSSFWWRTMQILYRFGAVWQQQHIINVLKTNERRQEQLIVLQFWLCPTFWETSPVQIIHIQIMWATYEHMNADLAQIIGRHQCWLLSMGPLAFVLGLAKYCK